MSRGGDWSLVGLASDPTPGSTHGVDALARRFCQVEDTAREAGSILARVDTAHGVWEGHAAEAFSAQVSDLPANMSKCEMAYGMVADALTAWSSAMDSCQGQADRGLEDALGAQADIDAAQAALDQALAHQSWWQGNLASQEEVYWRYKNVDEPPSWVDIPSVQDISSARSQVAQASMGVTEAQSALSGATSRFEAARKMILAAKQDYEEAAQNFVARVEEAKEESVRRDHWWESVANSELWQTIVTIATVVGFVAAFIFAPIGLVIGTVAGAILTADMILRFLDGETSTPQFLIEAALTFIPVGRILKSTQNGLRNANRFAVGVKRRPKAIRTVEDAGDWVTYRRVQGGGTGNRVSKVRIKIESGRIKIAEHGSNLTVSVDNGEHAAYFLANRRPGGQVVEFKVPKWFDDFVKENTIPQIGYRKNPANQGGFAPKRVDSTKPGYAVELPPVWIEWIEEVAVSGRVV